MTSARPLAALAILSSIGGCQSTGPTAFDHPPAESISDKPPVLTADTYLAAGQLAETQGDLPRAAAQYERAIATDAKDPRPLFALASLQSKARDHAAAVATWRKYVEASGGSAGAHSNLGFACELAGRPDEAEAAYKAGIARDPKNESCRVNYGLMLARLDREAEAERQLSAVLPPAAVRYDLGSVHELRGRLTLARAAYRQCLAIDPTFTDARKRLAKLDTMSRGATASTD